MIDLTVVIMTRNRRPDLMRALEHLSELPERPPIIVADNGSSDGTREAVRIAHPDVTLLEIAGNSGVAARNAAVRLADTTCVAFNDDDSWWSPGSLSTAVGWFARHPTLGAVTAHVVIEPDGRDDPTSLVMYDSPVQADPAVPGTPVLGFLGCATVVRRSAFVDVGGFEERLHFAGEEELLAMDLVDHGWQVRFVPELVVHHQASTSRDPAWRQRRDVRNALWSLWLRRPLPVAAVQSWKRLREAAPWPALGGALEAVARGGWIPGHRRRVSAGVERQLRRLEQAPADPIEDQPRRSASSAG